MLTGRVGSRYGREFRLYATGQAVSLVGDRIALIALVFLVIRLSRAYPPALALFYVSRVVPALLAGLIAGYIADAADRRRLLVGCDLGRAVLLALVPALTAASLLTVYPIAFLLYGSTVLFDATARAMLPDIVPEGELLGANAVMTRLETGADLAYAAGGVLVATFQPAVPFVLDAATFAVSGIAISLMRIPSPRAAVATTVGEIWARIREGLVFLMGQPFLRWSTLSSAAIPLAIGGVFVAAPLYASGSLGRSAGLVGPLHSAAFRFSVLEVSIGVGGVLGAMVAPRLARRMARGRLFALGMTGFGLVIAGLALTSNIYLAAGVMALSGVFNSLFAVAGSTLVQELTPSAMRGRVMAGRMTVVQGGLAAGSALGGYLLLSLSMAAVWLILGAFALLASASVWAPSAARNQP